MGNGNLAEAELTRYEHAAAMADYVRGGVERARAAGNRGPLRFDDADNVHPDVLAAYWKHGFYVFEGVVSDREIDKLRSDVADMSARLDS